MPPGDTSIDEEEAAGEEEAEEESSEEEAEEEEEVVEEEAAAEEEEEGAEEDGEYELPIKASGVAGKRARVTTFSAAQQRHAEALYQLYLNRDVPLESVQSLAAIACFAECSLQRRCSVQRLTDWLASKRKKEFGVSSTPGVQRRGQATAEDGVRCCLRPGCGKWRRVSVTLLRSRRFFSCSDVYSQAGLALSCDDAPAFAGKAEAEAWAAELVKRRALAARGLLATAGKPRAPKAPKKRKPNKLFALPKQAASILAGPGWAAGLPDLDALIPKRMEETEAEAEEGAQEPGVQPAEGKNGQRGWVQLREETSARLRSIALQEGLFLSSTTSKAMLASGRSQGGMGGVKVEHVTKLLQKLRLAVKYVRVCSALLC